MALLDCVAADGKQHVAIAGTRYFLLALNRFRLGSASGRPALGFVGFNQRIKSES